MSTKHIIFFSLILILNVTAIYAQSQNVGIGTSSPDASAILDLSATNKGILIPRLSTAQRTSIVTPANGLLVYDITTKSLWVYDQSVATWKQILPGGNKIVDADNNTGVYVEKNPNEDMIRFDLAGTEHLKLIKNANNISHLEFSNNSSNTFIGLNSALANSTGINNTSLGSVTLSKNTMGSYNTAIGVFSL